MSDAEIAGFAGGDARVVVFDASGSMRKPSFERQRTPRIDVAREVLKDVFRQLNANGDTRPTALSVFGARDAWDDASATFGGDPSRVPDSHPLCRDIQFMLDFAPISDAVVTRAEELADSLDSRGMTPIHISLLEGLRAFTGSIQDATLQFVLISDLDEPNCLPAGIKICDVLQIELDRIKGEGGKVEAIVFETPVAAILEPLSQCMSISTYVLDTEKPDPNGKVREAFDTLSLVPRLVVQGPSLDPDGIRTDTAHYEIADARSGHVVSSGPHGVFELPAERYAVSVTVDGQSASTTLDLDGAKSIDLGLPPAILTVDATTNGAPGPARLARLDIRRAGGNGVAGVVDYVIGDPLALANGAYELTGQDSNGQTATATVLLTLGRAQAVTLDFGTQAAAARSVIFEITVEQPTLSVGAAPAPAIELVHPGGLRERLSATGHSASLMPGRYQVQVSGSTPHVLAFDVAAGPGPLNVAVHVTPGWFVAQSSKGKGSFELFDAGGTALYSFDGYEVVHSLPEGRYALAFVGADGQTSQVDFDIRSGEETRLNLF